MLAMAIKTYKVRRLFLLIVHIFYRLLLVSLPLPWILLELEWLSAGPIRKIALLWTESQSATRPIWMKVDLLRVLLCKFFPQCLLQEQVVQQQQLIHLLSCREI